MNRLDFNPLSPKQGVYIHIPFCVSHCSYCDFAITTDLRSDIKIKYVEKLLSEIDQKCIGLKKKGWVKGPLSSIFFGGGTPSLLRPELLQSILDAIHSHVDWKEDIEITMEGNPIDFTTEYIDALASSTSINRLSIGVQSFNLTTLDNLGRFQPPSISIETIVESCKKKNFDNINLDLMFGLKSEKEEAFFFSLHQSVKLPIEHISLYELSLPITHPLKKKMAPPDALSRLHKKAISFLKKNYFFPYELSNFSKKNYESKHNLLYWTGGDFFGFGLSSASRVFVANSYLHYKETSDLRTYVSKDCFSLDTFTPLTKKEALLEILFLELRTHRGLHLDSCMARTGCNLQSSKHYKNLIKNKFIKEYEKNNTLFIRCTQKGLFLLESLVLKLIE